MRPNQSGNLTKEQYWEKWKFFELLQLLKGASAMLANYTGAQTSNYKSIEDFQRALNEEIDDIEYGNSHDLSSIWNWFSPQGTWSRFTGEEGEDVRKIIFEIADVWKGGNPSIYSAALKPTPSNFSVKKFLRQVGVFLIAAAVLWMIGFVVMLFFLV